MGILYYGSMGSLGEKYIFQLQLAFGEKNEKNKLQPTLLVVAMSASERISDARGPRGPGVWGGAPNARRSRGVRGGAPENLAVFCV